MDENLVLRKAKVGDALQIFKLVNRYSKQGLMLPRSQNQIYRGIRDFVVAERDGGFIGCGALNILWEDLAEIRSLAVVEEEQGRGVGQAMVRYLVREAHELGVPIVFALTYAPQFFLKMGFRLIDKNELPRKIWVDCIDCLKFPNCDEMAVILDLRTDAPQLHTSFQQQKADI